MEIPLKYEFNSEANDLRYSGEPLSSYVICSIPRAGSTLLSKSLVASGQVGAPHEYFNVDHLEDFKKRWNFKDITEYIALLKAHRTSENGVFGLKAHFHHYQSNFGASPLHQYFPKLSYVFIRRRNKIAQAVSWAIADQTGKWSSEFEGSKRPKFNYRHILKNYNLIKAEEKGWTDYFKQHGVRPFVVVYEDFERNYAETLNSIFRFLNIEPKRIPSTLPLEKQRGLINTIWHYRFLARYALSKFRLGK